MSSNYKEKQNILILAGTGQDSKQSRVVASGNDFSTEIPDLRKPLIKIFVPLQLQRRLPTKHVMDISSRKHIKAINKVRDRRENAKIHIPH